MANDIKTLGLIVFMRDIPLCHALKALDDLELGDERADIPSLQREIIHQYEERELDSDEKLLEDKANSDINSEKNEDDSESQAREEELHQQQEKKKRKNLVLSRALRGEQPVEDSVKELYHDFKWFKGLFWHGKNNYHNSRIADLGELLPTSDDFRKNGFFDSKAFFPTVAKTMIPLVPFSMLVAGVVELYTRCVYVGDDYLFHSRKIVEALDDPISYSFLSLAVYRGIANQYSKFWSCKSALNWAKYLDGKINDLA